MNEVSSVSFMIENTETERYSFNLVHYFLESEGYSIFNFEEKILENFNHDFYHIIIVYSLPLYNDVNVETLFEKLEVIKKRLKKNYFLFNQSILVLATNCSLSLNEFEIPANSEILDVSTPEQLLSQVELIQVFPKLKEVSLHERLEEMMQKINLLSIQYAKKINQIFNNKLTYANIVLTIVVIAYFLVPVISPEYFVMSKSNLQLSRYYTLFTNALFELNASSLLDYASLFILLYILLTFGNRIEKIYGPARYFLIVFITAAFTDSLVFAFFQDEVAKLGFTPVIFGLLGSFFYVALNFRRFFANSIRRFIILNAFFILIILLSSTYSRMVTVQLTAFFGSLLSGYIGGFIVGIPKTKNKNIWHRIIVFVLLIAVVSLSLAIGLK